MTISHQMSLQQILLLFLYFWGWYSIQSLLILLILSGKVVTVNNNCLHKSEAHLLIKTSLTENGDKSKQIRGKKN